MRRTNMKICSNCGNKLKDSSEFCSECGNFLSKKTSSIGKNKVFKIIGILCLVVIVAFGVKYIMGYKDSKAAKLVEVNGIVLTDNNSPENKFLLKYEENAESSEWKNFSDRVKEEKEINEQISSLKKSFDKENIKQIISHFSEAERAYYEVVLNANKDNFKVFSGIFENVEISYLSPPMESKIDTFDRMAEYKAVWNNQEFLIVFIKEDGTWRILSL